jgi:hypothetical protein
MRPKPVIINFLAILLLIGLVLSACAKIELPETPTIPQETTELPVATDPNPEATEATEAIDQNGTRIFRNQPFFNFMPFEMTFDPALWEPDPDLNGLKSTKIESCVLRPLLGRGAGPLEGPFSLQSGENNFIYRIERPQPGQTSFQTITYFLYLEPTQPEFQREDLLWAFEMNTDAKNETACFQEIQPLLETLSISLPKSHVSDYRMEWSAENRQQYCPTSTEGRIFTLASAGDQIVFSSGNQPGTLYGYDTNTGIQKPLISSKFTEGLIQPPIKIDGDYLVFLDSENFMMTQGWALVAYQLSTGESQTLVSSESHPTASALYAHFYLNNELAYATLVEHEPESDQYLSNILKFDLKANTSETIHSFESDKVRLGKLAANDNYLLAERVALTKDVDPNQSPLLIKFEPNNAVQGPFFMGWNPLISDDRVVLALGSPQTPARDILLSNVHGENPVYMKLLGDNVTLSSLDGDFLSWQSSVFADSPTTEIYLTDLEKGLSYNLVSTELNSALLMPILTEGNLLFGASAGFSTQDERTEICILPIDRLIHTGFDPAVSEILPSGKSVHASGLSFEVIPLLHSGLLDDRVFSKVVPLDANLADRLKPSLKEFGSFYQAATLQSTESFYAVEESLAKPDQAPPVSVVRVLKNNAEIFSVETGPIANASSLVSFLILDNGDWVLEIVEYRLSSGDGADFEPTSNIFYNGDSLKDQYSADEVFNYRDFGGKEFFFYRRGNQTGYVYDGTEVQLPLEKIQHNLCCGYALYDPVNYSKAITFYGMKAEQEYYLILELQKQ